MDWLLYKGVNEGGAIYLKPYLEGFYIEMQFQSCFSLHYFTFTTGCYLTDVHVF